MSPIIFTIAFVVFLFTGVILRWWLTSRQIKHLKERLNQVPPFFSKVITLDAHKKAIEYSIAKLEHSKSEIIINAVIVLALTLHGGIQLFTRLLSQKMSGGIVFQITLIAIISIFISLITLPLDYYRQFVIEKKFGFNNMTAALFISDTLKGFLVAAIIGIPLIWCALKLMGGTGKWWWFFVWLLWCGFQVLMLILYPTVIAPRFNKFTPLTDESLRMRIELLLRRTGFSSKGLFVIDASKRSSHGNAYFSGLGAAKRIVLFDTLIEKLNPTEIEAVLAHELGHFKMKHVRKSLILSCVLSLIFFAALGYLKNQGWFFASLGVTNTYGATDAIALMLFVLITPVFTFLFTPLMTHLSRKHENEADNYAAQYSSPKELASALLKMSKDNATPLTTDKLYSDFFHSHPPAQNRIAHLLKKAKINEQK